MKKTTTKLLSLCLCTALAVSGISLTARALHTQPDQPDTPQKTLLSASPAQAPASKDETVYVLAGADGAVQKIIVSDWLQNQLGSQTLQDKTDLTDVENVKGEEGYTLGEGNSRVWDAQGNDIYYQGNIEKELPVTLSVTYKLDGKAISPSELAGKSGRVTIRFDYTNQQYEKVQMDGKTENIYVPFAMLTGLLLDNDVFTNVEVSNGKCINDGSRTVVMGIAFPGLQENLAVSKDQFEIPSYVEISGDAKNFELGITVTLATNELFNQIDPDSLDAIREFGNSMEAFTGAMDQLLDGSSRLYDGLSTLLDKSGELVAGIDQLAAGAESLKTGAGDLDAGAVELQSGVSQLSSGLNTLVSNSGSLNSGARQVFETLLATANTQLAAAGLDVPALTIRNYAEILNGVIASLDENAVYEQILAAVTAAVEAQRSNIEEQVTAAVKQEVTLQVTAAVQEQVTATVTQAVRDTVTEQVIQSVLHMDRASYDAAVAAGLIDEETQAAIAAAIEQQMQSEQTAQLIQTKVAEQMDSQPVQDTIAAKVAEQMQDDAVKEMIAANTELQIQKAIADNMASDQVHSQLAAASEGAKSVIALKASLDSYNTFYLGLQSYTAGVSQAAAGAKELQAGTDALKDGTGKLSDGAAALSDGMRTLQAGAPALVDGVEQLQAGAMQLSDGLKTLNEQGIQKLVDAVDGGLDSLLTRLRATQDVSRRYKSFAGDNENMDGQVKFIYRTEPVG